jgi:hypothetical protein
MCDHAKAAAPINRNASQGHTANVGCCCAEWSEQQEDPNVEKLWEEDWDDDQV